MARHGGGVAQFLQRPRAGGFGIGQGLERGERLRRHDEEGALGGEAAHGLLEIRAVDVGYEAEIEIAFAVAAEGLVGHHGSEIAAADADVDDVGDGLPGEAEPFAGAHLVGELRHLAEHLLHRLARLGHLFGGERLACGGAQGRMQYGALLGDVDGVSAEHGVDAIAQAAIFDERDQQAQGLGGDAVLGVVEVQARRFGAHACAARRIFVEEVSKMPLLDLLVVGFKCAVRRAVGQHG